jgi:hypothetical protein
VSEEPLLDDDDGNKVLVDWRALNAQPPSGPMHDEEGNPLETTTPWREIDGKLLAAGLHEAFGTTGDAETTDINPEFVELLAEYLDEADLVCDHSVGICCCPARYTLEALRLWLAERAFCSACGGEGIGDMREEHVVDEALGIDFTDHIVLPCETCDGKGTVPSP